MKLVTIKRATTGGISVCCGELYEYAGFQFCITDSIDSNILYAIEVTTGLYANKVCISEYSSKRACINYLKRWIKKHISLFDDELFKRSKELLSEYNCNYPLNDKI